MIEQAAAGAQQGADIAAILLAVIVILAAAKLLGHLFVRAGQPAVLGELAVGILIGNFGLLGYHGLELERTEICRAPERSVIGSRALKIPPIPPRPIRSITSRAAWYACRACSGCLVSA